MLRRPLLTCLSLAAVAGMACSGPSSDPSDAGADLDAGVAVEDGGGVVDAGASDAGPSDAGASDAGASDAGPGDGGSPDAGWDAGTPVGPFPPALLSGARRMSGGTLTLDVQLGQPLLPARMSGGTLTLEEASAIKR